MNRELQRVLEDAAWDGDVIAVVHLVNHPDVDPAADRSTALLHAAHSGHWRCVEILLPVSNPLERNSEALWRSARHGHGRVVRLLAPASSTGGWEPWMWAELSPTMARMVARFSSTIAGTAGNMSMPPRKPNRKVRTPHDT
jgi:hypothetical protein